MKELIKKRHLIPIAVWFVIYMGLFGFLEIVPPKEVHLIHCALDGGIYLSICELVSIHSRVCVSCDQESGRQTIQESGTGSDHRHEHFPVHFLRMADRTEPP